MISHRYPDMHHVQPWLSLTYTVFSGYFAQSAPYPFVLDFPTDVPLEECRSARPQLYFTCYLGPKWLYFTCYLGPIWDAPGREVANRLSHVWRGPYPSSQAQLSKLSSQAHIQAQFTSSADDPQHLSSAGPALFRSDGDSDLNVRPVKL